MEFAAGEFVEPLREALHGKMDRMIGRQTVAELQITGLSGVFAALRGAGVHGESDGDCKRRQQNGADDRGEKR